MKHPEGVGHAGSDQMSSVPTVSGFLWKLLGYIGISSQEGSLGLPEALGCLLEQR